MSKEDQQHTHRRKRYHGAPHAGRPWKWARSEEGPQRYNYSKRRRVKFRLRGILSMGWQEWRRGRLWDYYGGRKKKLGFQLIPKPFKLKLPRRVLRDQQEKTLWREEEEPV